MTAYRFTRPAIILHWLIAGLILFDFVLALAFEDMPRDVKQGAVQIHKSIGLTILGLLVLRIVWRVTHAPPPPPATMSQTMRRLAALGHGALYALTALVPLSAILFIFWRGGSLDYFGLFTITSPFTQNRELGGLLKEAHEVLAWLLILAAGAHSAMALFHNYDLRDALLARMGVGAPRLDLS